MKVKCEYCGSFISDTDEKCPNCGGTNDHLLRSAEGVPKTLEELRNFCAQRQLPLEKMRFFIGEDYKRPRAFGIYREEDGDLIVYKNKADGSRAVRYRGKDEAYAVNEIYQKLRSEILARKGKTTKSAPAQKPKKPKGCLIAIVVAVLLLVLGVFAAVKAIDAIPNTGYYSYNDDCYYNSGSSWYLFDSLAQDWVPAIADQALTDDYTGYWQGYDYDSSLDAGDFADSQFYDAGTDTGDTADAADSGDDWDSDWDDSDWDSDFSSWDSSDTDWSSDW